MKTLSTYKSEYKKAKTQKCKSSAINRAMLNLPYDDKQSFMKWQTEDMNKEYNSRFE